MVFGGMTIELHSRGVALLFSLGQIPIIDLCFRRFGSPMFSIHDRTWQVTIETFETPHLFPYYVLIRVSTNSWT
jgi:hypothetical protein